MVSCSLSQQKNGPDLVDLGHIDVEENAIGSIGDRKEIDADVKQRTRGSIAKKIVTFGGLGLLAGSAYGVNTAVAAVQHSKAHKAVIGVDDQNPVDSYSPTPPETPELTPETPEPTLEFMVSLLASLSSMDEMVTSDILLINSTFLHDISEGGKC